MARKIQPYAQQNGARRLDTPCSSGGRQSRQIVTSHRLPQEALLSTLGYDQTTRLRDLTAVLIQQDLMQYNEAHRQGVGCINGGSKVRLRGV